MLYSPRVIGYQSMATKSAYRDWTPVPTIAITLPLELPLPDGFDHQELETWPLVEGRLEYVDGRLLYMPPSGDEQQDTVADVTVELGLWTRAHPDFLASTNEAGMILGRDVRAADAAVYRRTDVGSYTGGLRRVPPVLAVEVAGKDEPPELLSEKASWYLERGVEVVWILVPRAHHVIVNTLAGRVELGPGDRLPAHPSLPGLEPRVNDLFRQIRRV
jgi:Uma2 family endonuclease